MRSLSRFTCFVLLLAAFLPARAQTYAFAQLNGTPLNTAGWNLAGAAAPGNVTGTGNSELILTSAINNQSGAIFFGQPINLAQCVTWTAEFDFRINGGTAADGLSFCFLDVPPTGFVAGGGLGIPGTANGLKVCFDTYNNCGENTSTMPKIELRWGIGYNECTAQPTAYNTGGNLSFLRSTDYNHAKITYNSGNIEVYVNNNLYLTGTQSFNFVGYFGFTASTGALNDVHSIKNVAIYTNMPPSEGGPNVTICTSGTATLGTASDPNYTYQWTPSTGLSSTTVANPQVTLSNTGITPIVQKYYVNTSFASGAGCSSRDSVLVTVMPAPSISIAGAPLSICSGATVNFFAQPINGGAGATYSWKVNGTATGATGGTFSSNGLNDNDVVTCDLITTACGTVSSNSVTISVSPVAPLTASITATNTAICPGTPVTFTATAAPASATFVYQWKKNGTDVGTNATTFTDNTLAAGDVVTCFVSSATPCLTNSSVTSNAIIITLSPPQVPTITIAASATTICPGGTVSFTATASPASLISYQWKKNGIDVGTNSASYSPAAIANGDVVSCVISSTSNCVSPSSATSNAVTIAIEPPVNFDLGPATGFCPGQSLTLDAGTAFASYQWSTGATTQTITVNTPGTYSVTGYSALGCPSTDNIQVSAYTAPVVNLGPSGPLCTGSSLTLDAGSYPSYLWADGSTVRTQNVSAPGAYSVTVTDANGCKGTGTYTVTSLLPLPADFLPPDTAICSYGTLELQPTQTFNSYLWNTNATVAKVTITQAGLYWLQVKDGNNCTGRDSINVLPKDCLKGIYVPNAFTPDGNGKNDSFRPLLFGRVKSYQFYVFNRWGNIIFQSAQPGKGWDGTLEGVKQTTGTFVWLCRFQFEGEPERVEKGSFVLIR